MPWPHRKVPDGIPLTAQVGGVRFTLARQVQATCDTAKLAASRLTGKGGPGAPARATERLRGVAGDYPLERRLPSFASIVRDRPLNVERSTRR
jgi:hypothetical protein